MKQPTGRCALCNEEFSVDELSLLPEMEAYARASAMANLDGKPCPTAPDEAELKEKYAFGYHDLFCSRCMKGLLAIARKRDENQRGAGGC